MAPELREFTRHFRAMGTDVDLWLWHTDEQRARRALAYAERFFAQTEAQLSRFRPRSELSRLNGQAGQPFRASPTLFGIVKSALEWRVRTNGIFDPTILNALVAYGYDRTFCEVQAAETLREADETGSHRHKSVSSGRADDILLGPGRQVRLPAGLGLDLGGIAKGWTIQQAAHRLGALGPALVDAGGDIASAGAPPEGPWMVSVADPQTPALDIAYVPLSNQAVATSSRARRRWMHNSKPAHHLIDPRTGAPADTDVLSATVIAPRLPDAEIYAKTALILGADKGLAYLSHIPSVSSLLVTADGGQRTSGLFETSGYALSTVNFTDLFRRPA